MINIVNSFHLWGVFIFTCLAIFIAFEAGMALGKRHRLTSEKEDRSSIGSIVAASLGLLAFLLAFTFGIAASKFDERRELVVEEANAIGTTYLRAGYLGNPYNQKIRELLNQYVTVRLEAIKLKKVEEGIKESEKLQDLLWQQAIEVAEKHPDSVVVGLFIQSLNEVIDLHAKRVNVGLHIRIPYIIWGALYFITMLSIGSLGYQFGLTHARYIGITLLLIATLSSVITLIADLDRPGEGFIQVSQRSLSDLNEKMMNDSTTTILHKQELGA